MSEGGGTEERGERGAREAEGRERERERIEREGESREREREKEGGGEKEAERQRQRETTLDKTANDRNDVTGLLRAAVETASLLVEWKVGLTHQKKFIF